MTNEQKAEQYRLSNHSQADNDFQNAMNIAVWKAYVAACEWKDSQLPYILKTFADWMLQRGMFDTDAVYDVEHQTETFINDILPQKIEFGTTIISGEVIDSTQVKARTPKGVTFMELPLQELNND